MITEKGLELSLSDHYWLCPAGSGLLWEEVNFFEHSLWKFERVALSAKKQVFVDNVQFDVERDVAYSEECEK